MWRDAELAGVDVDVDEDVDWALLCMMDDRVRRQPCRMTSERLSRRGGVEVADAEREAEDELELELAVGRSMSRVEYDRRRWARA